MFVYSSLHCFLLSVTSCTNSRHFGESKLRSLTSQLTNTSILSLDSSSVSRKFSQAEIWKNLVLALWISPLWRITELHCLIFNALNRHCRFSHARFLHFVQFCTDDGRKVSQVPIPLYHDEKQKSQQLDIFKRLFKFLEEYLHIVSTESFLINVLYFLLFISEK